MVSTMSCWLPAMCRNHNFQQWFQGKFLGHAHLWMKKNMFSCLFPPRTALLFLLVKSTILPTKSSHSGNLQSYLEIETKAPLLVDFWVVQISWVVPAYFNGKKKIMISQILAEPIFWTYPFDPR